MQELEVQFGGLTGCYQIANHDGGEAGDFGAIERQGGCPDQLVWSGIDGGIESRGCPGWKGGSLWTKVENFFSGQSISCQGLSRGGCQTFQGHGEAGRASPGVGETVAGKSNREVREGAGRNSREWARSGSVL